MRFYHYTGAANVEPIRELGVVASPAAFDGLGISGVAAVWLTTSDDWPLATRAMGERSARRVVVELSIAEQYLWRWRELGPKLCAMAGGALDDLQRFNRDGHDEWWVYLRSIAPERVGRIEQNPALGG